MFCKELWLYLLYLLLRPSNAQIKPCYTYDGQSSPDFPCDPEADVSSCCGGGWRCITNLICKKDVTVIGTCTDRRWAESNDPSCPFRLSMRIMSSWCSLLQYLPFIDLDLTTDLGNTSNQGRPHAFDYKLNTTLCSDETICPNNLFSSCNGTCCDKHQGIQEINYHNNAIIPDAASDLPGKNFGLNHIHWALHIFH